LSKEYFRWLSESTPTRWWNDSANPGEILAAKELGAVGVTTNPVLTFKTFNESPDFWREQVAAVPKDIDFIDRAETYLKMVATYAAAQFTDVFEATGGEQGLALGQLNPSWAGDADRMIDQSRRIHSWAPNIAIKLPATRSGIECISVIAAEGIPVCATINVSVSQALAVAEAYEAARKKAIERGVKPALCLVVQQVGRVDDYLRDIAHDSKSPAREGDIIQAGIAMTKRTYGIFKERGYHSVIMPAGLRGTYHITELAGAKMTFSIHPRVQKMVLEQDLKCEERIDIPVEKDVIDRLMTMPEFRKCYEPDGLKPDEFIAYGVTQKLLSQFTETGWAMLETYGSDRQTGRWT